MADMGYQNVDKVFKLSSEGRLAKPRGGKLTINTMALGALVYMAQNTYSYPPTEKMKRDGVPCCYYTMGWRSISNALGMTLLTAEQTMSENADNTLKTRENTAKTRVSEAWKFLQKQGLIKQLVPASLGKNAGYLLLLGDDKENREVERYARECLGLPFMR